MLVSHLGAAAAAADRLFHLIYRGFSCIDFSDPSHTYLPIYGPRVGAPEVLTTGATPVSTFGMGGWLPEPHREYGDGRTSHDQADR